MENFDSWEKRFVDSKIRSLDAGTYSVEVAPAEIAIRNSADPYVLVTSLVLSSQAILEPASAAVAINGASREHEGQNSMRNKKPT